MSGLEILVPVWIVVISIFLGGVIVGKFLFEPKVKKYLRPSVPPEPKSFTVKEI